MVFKKQDQFAILLKNISTNLKEGAYFFADYKLNNVSDLKVFFEEIKALETKGDSFVHETIQELNKVFITPIEREDILQLAMSMDDVLDGIEACSALFEMYSITQADEYMVKFVNAIRACSDEIDESIDLLTNKKLPLIREHAIKIKDYESKCDGILRQSIKHLFLLKRTPFALFNIKKFMKR